MSNITARPMLAFAALAAFATVLASCNKADNSSGLLNKNGVLGALDSAVRADRASAPDPCAYLAAGEAESFIGKLKMPPYRATDDESAT